MRDGQPVIVIADDDPDIHVMIEDCLHFLQPQPRFLYATNIDDLIQTIRMQEVDLITLDLDFTPAQDNGHGQGEGLDALPALTMTRPRVPIVIVSGKLDLQRTMRAMRDNTQVRGVVEKTPATFDDALMAMSTEAIRWGQEQRRKADALFEQAESASESDRPVDAARLYLEAYQTGDLSSKCKALFGERLAPLLPALHDLPHFLADAYRCLIESCWDNNDVIGLIFQCRQFRKHFPEFATEALRWEVMCGELEDRVYAIIDARLDLAGEHAANGRFREVLGECHLIQAALANVLPSYVHEAEAYRHLGDSVQAIETYFELADMYVMNGELDGARGALQQITLLDLAQTSESRVSDKYKAIGRISQRLEELRANNHYPYLKICGLPNCRADADASESFFLIDSTLHDGDCDICGKGFDHAVDALKNKTITVIGGRFGSRYKAAFLRLGAKEVHHHDAIHELPRIPRLIAPADGVLIVTGFASHAGTIKAECELARSRKPYSRIHFYGVRQVVRGLVLDLVPRMTDSVAQA